MDKKVEGYIPSDTHCVILTAVMNVLYYLQGISIEEATERIGAGTAADPRTVARNLLSLVQEHEAPEPKAPVDFAAGWTDILRRSILLPDGAPPELEEFVREIVELSSREESPDERRLNVAFDAACRLLGTEPVS